MEMITWAYLDIACMMTDMLHIEIIIVSVIMVIIATTCVMWRGYL